MALKQAFVAESIDGLGLRTIFFTMDSRFRDVRRYRYASHFAVNFGATDPNIWRPEELRDLQKVSKVVVKFVLKNFIK